jgi:hypothetical protein
MTCPTPLSRWRLRERKSQGKQDPQAPKTNFHSSAYD